ncbi:MAG TPA: DUF2804 domain-containing protein [Polyangiaceae bacterium LLY-WYZ-15_(1-7)]|nr:hypothetical protein [Sandaracinus sp.]HJL05513.1 DUF2804 domain-containing protein [Polyangiaceae bacterium LLY-WYZ-15_(1-7)]HJL13754.1 DUF2804 domain-containing protein [Polyangiaceae bacterium LLY-WYZ-15_(1-7)]HJL21261.1 DUF2804 domain-containing protein [Polyangiaceae bacterium LLY-WYZ-15_(1-7)]
MGSQPTTESAPPRPALPLPPASTRVDGAWQWGRYRAPFRKPDVGATLAKRFRLKEWHYVSLDTERLFLAFGLVQLGYVGNAFLYLVDKKQPTVAKEYTALSLLGRHLDFAESSVGGETRWKRRDAEIRVSWRGPRPESGAFRGAPAPELASPPGAWEVRLDLMLGEEHVRGGFRARAAEGLALLHDLGDARPAYTHKAAGLEARGSLRVGEEAIDLAGGLAVSDWTRSLAARETRWKWASFAGRAGGHSLGLNLSAEVYDDANGDSLENALWVDGRVQPLGGVEFDVPPIPGVEDWHIRSREGDEVDLVFRPLGARAQHLDMKVLQSDFVQPYGTFHGHVAGHRVDDLFGVVEDHLSVW